MAKILLSIPGESIATRVAGTVFQKTRYGLCAQRIGLQRLTPTALQLRERSVFKTIATEWNDIPSGTKAGYRDGAPPGFTGYMLYLQRAIPVLNSSGIIVPAYTPAITPVQPMLPIIDITKDLGSNRYLLRIRYLLLPPPSIDPNVGECFYYVERSPGVQPKRELANRAETISLSYQPGSVDMSFAFYNDGPQGPMNPGDTVYFWSTTYNYAGGIQITETFSHFVTIPN